MSCLPSGIITPWEDEFAARGVCPKTLHAGGGVHAAFWLMPILNLSRQRLLGPSVRGVPLYVLEYADES